MYVGVLEIPKYSEQLFYTRDGVIPLDPVNVVDPIYHSAADCITFHQYDYKTWYRKGCIRSTQICELTYGSSNHASNHRFSTALMLVEGGAEI